MDPDPLVRGMDPPIRIRIHTKCHGSATLAAVAQVEVFIFLPAHPQ
jgi:hypothetical protein